ncbi:MAG: hypothetical protein ABI614_24410 [Planctomycetota bacterium]
MNLALKLTSQELAEIRDRTCESDNADAVTRAAQEFLRVCRSRELTSLAADLDYDENAWRDLDEAELRQPGVNIEMDAHPDA